MNYNFDESCLFCKIINGDIPSSKVYETEKQFKEHALPVGTVDTDQKTYFRIAVKDGYVNLLSIQLAGKKRMNIGDFLRGYRHIEKSWVE